VASDLIRRGEHQDDVDTALEARPSGLARRQGRGLVPQEMEPPQRQEIGKRRGSRGATPEVRQMTPEFGLAITGMGIVIVGLIVALFSRT
jgi:hypothetical protein